MMKMMMTVFSCSLDLHYCCWWWIHSNHERWCWIFVMVHRQVEGLGFSVMSSLSSLLLVLMMMMMMCFLAFLLTAAPSHSNFYRHRHSLFSDWRQQLCVSGWQPETKHRGPFTRSLLCSAMMMIISMVVFSPKFSCHRILQLLKFDEQRMTMWNDIYLRSFTPGSWFV